MRPALLFTLALGCGGGPSAGPDKAGLRARAAAAFDEAPLLARAQSSARKSYPDSEFLVGHGFHPKDLGEAKRRAKAAVAESISSTIKSQLETLSAQADDRERFSSEQRIVTTTAFQRAELIQTPPAVTKCEPEGCRALAVLERAVVSRELKAEYEDAAGPFRRATERATAEGIDPLAFTRAWRVAHRAWLRMLPLAYQLTALAAVHPAEVAGDRRMRRKLDAARDGLMADLRVSITPGAFAKDPLGPRLQQALAKALGSLKITASPAPRCQSSVELRPKGQVTCKRAAFGPRCQLALQLTLRDCERKRDLREIDFADAKLSATSTRNEARARTALKKKLKAEALIPILRRHLGVGFPLE